MLKLRIPKVKLDKAYTNERMIVCIMVLWVLSVHLTYSFSTSANMKVDQLKAIRHVALLQVVEQFKHFGQGEAELGAIAGAGAPAAGAARG